MHVAVTDPCEEVSGRFIPYHLAHDVLLPGIALLQLEQDLVLLMHDSESGS